MVYYIYGRFIQASFKYKVIIVNKYICYRPIITSTAVHLRKLPLGVFGRYTALQQKNILNSTYNFLHLYMPPRREIVRLFFEASIKLNEFPEFTIFYMTASYETTDNPHIYYL